MNNTIWKILVAVLTLVIVVGAIIAVVYFNQPGCEHTFEETVLTPATCVGEGVMQRKCTNPECGWTENETIPALGHADKKVPRKDATCTEEGHVAYVKCERCDRSTLTADGIIPALGHDYSEYYGASVSTCFSYGYEAGLRCFRCKDVKYAPVQLTDLADHTYLTEDAKAATCQPGNHEYRYCAHDHLCGYNQMEMDPDKYYIAPLYNHIWAIVETQVGYKAPTCEGEGYYKYAVLCTTCNTEVKPGSQRTEYIPALGHDMVTHNAKAPTCTELGWEEYVCCSRCTESEVPYVDIPALGHDEEYIPETPATCTETGLTEGYKCSRCNEILSGRELIPALGHAEKGERAINVDPTCLEDGSYVKVVVCKNPGCEYNIDVTAVTEENIDEVKFLANQGKVIINKLGHAYVEHEGKAANCLETGWDSYVTCKRCDYTNYKMTNATGHTVGTPATCTEPAICAACNVYFGDALGHDKVSHEAKAQNCTGIGWNAYETCNRCDYTTYVELPIIPHTEVIDQAKPANCLETGLTQGKHCSACGLVIIPQNVTAALGHDMNEVTGKCNRSGCTESYSVGLAYEFNADGTLTVAGMGSCKDVNVVIPAVYDGKAVTSISASAFYYNTSIKSVVIPDSVVSIGNYAFFYCDRLTTVTIGSGVRTIGLEAFNYCPISVVNYTGSAAQWNSISIAKNNSPLTGATRKYI